MMLDSRWLRFDYDKECNEFWGGGGGGVFFGGGGGGGGGCFEWRLVEIIMMFKR